MLLFYVCFSQAQSSLQQPPIISLFNYLNVNEATVKGAAPHFPFSYSSHSDFQQKLSGWLEQYPKEWKSLSSLPVFTKGGIGWTTYGIPEKYIEQPKTVNSSWYQWYQASGVTADKKKLLFPHFPELDNSLEGDAQGDNFERRVGFWQRLYPKEYITFLNTPELKALNPYAPEKITINYMPRFLGAEISNQLPVKGSTKDKLQDDFDYQLKLRNWYFVFNPAEFTKRYGKDYDFPSTFNADEYRKEQKLLIERKQSADYNTLKHGK